MKKYFSLLLLCLFLLLSGGTFAQQVDSSRIASLQKEIDRDQRKADKLKRKAEKQDKKQKRHERKMERKQKKRDRKLESIRRSERRLQEASQTTTSSRNR